VHQTKSWKCLAEFCDLTDVNSVVFSPDGSHVVSGSDDSTVRFWNLVTGEGEAELKGHLGYVNSVVFSPDGNHVVSGSDSV
jgi:WD40 repeat protein